MDPLGIGKKTSVPFLGTNSHLHPKGTFKSMISLPETNSSHLKMDGRKTTFPFQNHLFMCKLLVSGRVSLWVEGGICWFPTGSGPHSGYMSDRQPIAGSNPRILEEMPTSMVMPNTFSTLISSCLVLNGGFQNHGTPKSSILIGFSIINYPFWDTTILGNHQIFKALWTVNTHQM